MQQFTQPTKKTLVAAPRSTLLSCLCISVVALSLLTNVLWFTSYWQNRQMLKAIHQTVSAYQTQPPTAQPYSYLDTLNTLYALKQETAQSQLLKFANWILPADKTAKHTANLAYQHLLESELLPDLQMRLSIEMQSSTLTHPSDLYSALKVYLMLSNSLPRDTHYIEQWFQDYWQRTLPAESSLQQRLNNLLAASLKQPHWSFSPDPALVQQARAILKQIPPPQLSLVILEDRASHLPPLALFDAKTAQLFNGRRSVPAVYTVAYLGQAYYQWIPQACQEVANDSAVLGISPLQVSNAGFNLLINEARILYLQRYAQTWQQLLTNFTLTKPANFNQSLQLVGALSDFHSPLLHLYSLVLSNTAPNPNIPQFDTLVSRQFVDTRKVMAHLTSESWQSTWRDLDQYLGSATGDEQLFQLVAKRMANATYDDALSRLFQQAADYPEPLKSWSLQLANNIWEILLANTHAYLNQVWANTVLPEYDAVINQRYPLFKNAVQEMSLDEFTQFFGPGGTLDNFVTTYLQPFIDDSHHYWTWKTVGGQHLNISQTTLDMFIRAALIQKAYFDNDTNRPQIAFQLLPVSLGPEVHRFTLQIDDKPLPYVEGKKVTLTWPGAPTTTITLQLFTKHNQERDLAAKGLWAWFRLLDQADVQPTSDPKQLGVTFTIDGHPVKYHLQADNIINPFMPGILEGLHLPQNL